MRGEGPGVGALPAAASPAFYGDLSGFADLRLQARRDSPEALEAVAKQFEGIFLQMALASMRSASGGDPLFDGPGSDIYRDMFDRQMSSQLSGGLGLARLLVEQLRGQAPDDPGKSEAAGEAGVLGPLGELGAARAPVAPAPRPRALAPASAPRAAPAPPRASDAAAVSPAAEPGDRDPLFASPSEFVSTLWPHAVAAGERLGADPRLLLAQAALETGWGRHVIRRADGSSSHNLFGIKAGSGWEGDTARVGTLEHDGTTLRRVQADFRAYPSVAASFADYADLIAGRPRYAGALAADDAEGYARGLGEAGYATDPVYADKLLTLMRGGVARALDRAGIEPGSTSGGTG